MYMYMYKYVYTVPVKSNLTFLSYFYPTSIPHHLQPRLEMGRAYAKLHMLLC